jgi:pre-peptidase
MRLGRGHAAFGVVLSCAALETCVFPTERDEAVRVSIDPLPVLIRGNDASATARAWQVLAGGDSQPLANVTFVWSSDSTSIATVDATGHIVGIKSGTTIIRARTANFDRQSLPGEIILRVSAPLEVDSIRPQTVRPGETVTVYGVGVDSIFQASIGDGVLIPYLFSNVRDSSGSAQITYWVPPPARTDSLFFIGNGVFGLSKDTVRVMRPDLYEPNDLSPDPIDLEASRPFPGTILDFFLFLNPALAFEPLLRDQTEGVDWYRLTQTAPRDLTIVLSSDVPGTFETFLTDSLRFQASDTSYRVGPNSWTFGPQSHACHGAGFAPQQAPSESTIVALKDFPAGALHAIGVYTQPGRYALSVSEGYATTGKGITRDAHEEDDYCNAADAKRVVLSATTPEFRYALTIDNPHDVDWFRFYFPGGANNLVVHTAARPLGAADSSDIDLYLLQYPATVVAISGRANSTEDIQLVLPPAGEYYAVAIDFAGVPTPYSLCIGMNSCALPAASASSAADLQSSIARRARLEAAIARRSPRSPTLRVPSRLR